MNLEGEDSIQSIAVPKSTNTVWEGKRDYPQKAQAEDMSLFLSSGQCYKKDKITKGRG